MSSESSISPAGYQRSGRPFRSQLTRERLSLRSGVLVIIDQFMLANSQFLSMVNEQTSKGRSGATPDPEKLQAAVRPAVEAYGGCVLRMDPAPCEVLRDPQRFVMLVCDEGTSDGFMKSGAAQGDSGAIFDSFLSRIDESQVVGRLLVDTRCAVFLDALLLEDREALGRFAELRRTGDEKGARDLLRERGAAVRYGFQKYGDELAVRYLEVENCVILSPDVVD